MPLSHIEPASLADAPVLPPWATALPLWAAGGWIWISAPPDAPLRYWPGGPDGALAPAPLPHLEGLPPGPAYPLIVLDYQAGPVPPAGWWALLAAALAPGGVVFVCGPHPAGLATIIHAAAPDLHPADPHLIEPGQDGYWFLRPAGPAFRRLIARQLQPPLSVRAWLTQARRRVRPPASCVPCLPVWRAGGSP
jgi:hypothetical protein